MGQQVLHSDYENLAKVQEQHQERLFSCPNVVGVGIGRRYRRGVAVDNEGPVITVLVERKIAARSLRRSMRVDKILEKQGVPIDVVETGRISVAASASLHGEIRPAMGGFNIAHFSGMWGSGTLGTCCYRDNLAPGQTKEIYLLSNNHVIGGSNDAANGDPILQPSSFFGGTTTDHEIATLTGSVPIQFHDGSDPPPKNYVDAAIAEGDLEKLSREIYWIGYLQGSYTPPQYGDPVQKTGAKTGYTTGVVENVNLDLNVGFPGGRQARFCQQIATTYMTDKGDSGSIFATMDRRPVGLFFADSWAKSRSYVNPMTLVESSLGIVVTET